jgi:hypothetical protein
MNYRSLIRRPKVQSEDELFVLFGPLFFVNHRCNYATVFGSDVSKNFYTIPSMETDLLPKRNTTDTNENGFKIFHFKYNPISDKNLKLLKKDYYAGEIVSTDYGISFKGCRCKSCKIKTQYDLRPNNNFQRIGTKLQLHTNTPPKHTYFKLESQSGDDDDDDDDDEGTQLITPQITADFQLTSQLTMSEEFDSTVTDINHNAGVTGKMINNTMYYFNKHIHE